MCFQLENMQNESSSKVNGLVDGGGDKNSLDQSGSVANELVCELKADSENIVKKLDEIVRNLNNVPCVYGQDIVRHKMHNVVGVVSEVAGESDSDGSIMDDDDDDDDDEDDDEDASDEGVMVMIMLMADQVRVVWMGDVKPVQHVNDVTVIDRGFLHGDYVASASDPTGQVGVVVDVNISVDLLAPYGSVIKDVSSKDLVRVSEFTVVDDVVDDVTVLFDDGSVCKVKGAEPLHLKPISKGIFEEDEHFPYHPGQRVRATSSSVFKNSSWLSGLWKANRLEGTVTKVTSGSVFIYWIASASYGSDSSTTPAEEQDPKKLELLSCFAHASWQVGDWCHLPSSVVQSSSVTLDEDLLKLGIHDSAKKCELDSSQLGNELTALDGNVVIIANNESSSCGSSTSISKVPAHRKKIRKVLIRREKKTQKQEEDFERALLIVNTRTRVDIAWQDGTIEHGLNSTTLIPIDSPGDHEFVAEQYVVEKASDDVDNSFECRRVGVVKSLNAKERTACVRWLKPVARAEDPHEFDKDEIVSVYELKTHPDYDYSYGDVVVRLSPVSVSDQTSSDLETNGESKQQSRQSEIMNTRKCLGHKKGDDAPNDVSMGSSDLSWVGNISGLRNGDLEVTWADGMVSMVGPQAIFVVGGDDDNDSVSFGSEVSEAAASWETVDDALDYTQEEVVLQDAIDMNSEEEESVEYSSGRNAALNFPLAALDFVARFATGIFSRGQKNINPDFPGYKGENELHSQGTSCVSEQKYSSDESSAKKSNVNNNCGMQNTNGKEKHASVGDPGSSHAVETSCNLSTENSNAMTCSEARIHHDFKHFDTAKDPLDHHFLDSNGQINNGRKWLKKVQQDWNILQNNLSDEIYVRVYEDQMDLLRATIIGAYGTPYQDGLFFFDFHLPPEYPDVPPSAYYHSGGWQINPNLYEEGKVCLSLLNTWTGRGNEVWHSSSSILQVLVSLQGLVLNSRPYFNEAGYDKQIRTAEGEKNSLSYNENTFLLNCKTMMYLMRKPPKDFEDLVVKEHFRRRGYYILKACDAYMQGNLIGSLARDASVSSKESSSLTSVGFKLMLAKIVPKLYLALNEVGADCNEFKHLLQS
ncbi:ubiquitin-conjugating enzyme [Salix suchowensis]|nr:ubiquitin-conjugating enzyme [Salix suchowensis]